MLLVYFDLPGDLQTQNIPGIIIIFKGLFLIESSHIQQAYFKSRGATQQTNYVINM